MEYFLQYSSRKTKLLAHYNKQAIFPGKGKRGEITEFSARSRKRLFEKMIELDIRGDGAFLTLTFPDWLERDKTKYKKCFDAMRKAIEKKGSAVWKLEFTRKGVPHYHVLIDCDVPRKGIKLERQVWRDRWTKIVTRTFAAGTELERRRINFIRISFDRVRNRAAFANYFCYYFSTHKHYQNIIPDWFRGGSRLWGVWGDWKKVERSCIKISEKEYSGIRAEAISLIKKKKPSYYNNGFKVVYYGDLASAREAVEFNKILGRLVYDSQSPVGLAENG